MKHIYKIIVFLFLTGFTQAQIGYNFTALGGAYTPIVGATTLHTTGVDDALSATVLIGFNFNFGCVNYTQMRVSSNGWVGLTNTNPGSMATNALAGANAFPIIAPLWDDLATGTGGCVRYVVTGVSPNRILTIEWLNMEWYYTGTNPAISFQAKLYETSGRIDFVYRQEAAAVTPASASIGIKGPGASNYYSLNNTSAAPVPSQVFETTTITTKPATGQIYRWDPILCSGAPTASTAVATPSLKCAAFTTTLSLSGSTSACGLTYQWQSGPTAGGPWANIVGATSSSASVAVPATTFYRCILACGASTAASAPATASLATLVGCGICGGVTSITLPYSVTGTTTCGAGDDVTAGNVVPCLNANYLGGEDVVYSFTSSINGQIPITFSTSGSSAGITIWNGCPVSGGSCQSQVVGISSFSGLYKYCLNASAGVVYYLVVDSWPAPACNAYNLSIGTPVSNTVSCSLSTYTPSNIGYSFDAFVGTVLPTTDDVLFTSIINFGFPFCYGGSQYWGGYVASNSAFVFDAVPCFPNIQTNVYAAGGVGTGFTIPTPAPVNNTSIPRNAILAPWQDIDPSIGGTIRYATLGVAPNRRFVASWQSIPMYSCGTSSPAIYYTGQIKLFETTNNIEIHVGNKGVCPGFNGGKAVLGLHSYDGTVYIPPVNATIHNSPAQWSMTNTAYRFASPCAVSGPCLTLPINFKNFYGQQIEATNKLTWETALEENITEYIIERSSDAINFTEIGKALPYNQPSKYDFKDVTFKPNIINYYKVTALEKDGKRKSTNTIPIGGNYEDINVSEIYPNPIRDNFTLSYNAKIETEVFVSIKDMYGRVVKATQHSISVGNTQTMINCPELTSGVYIVEVAGAINGKVISQQKLIVVN
jgi:hypothetical protein